MELCHSCSLSVKYTDLIFSLNRQKSLFLNSSLRRLKSCRFYWRYCRCSGVLSFSCNDVCVCVSVRRTVSRSKLVFSVRSHVAVRTWRPWRPHLTSRYQTQPRKRPNARRKRRYVLSSVSLNLLCCTTLIHLKSTDQWHLRVAWMRHFSVWFIYSVIYLKFSSVSLFSGFWNTD